MIKDGRRPVPLGGRRPVRRVRLGVQPQGRMRTKESAPTGRVAALWRSAQVLWGGLFSWGQRCCDQPLFTPFLA